MTAATWIPVPEGSPFPLENLPLAVGAPPGGAPRALTALGEVAVDLAAVADLGLLDGTDLPADAFAGPDLNRYLAAGPSVGRAVRERLTEVLTDPSMAERLGPAVLPQDELVLGVPVQVGDFVDFYSSRHHAENLGRLFRPGDDPLPAHWRHLPMGYHGRSGTVVASGTAIPRPCGLRPVDGVPAHGPTAALDVELEVGFVTGRPNRAGQPVPVDSAADHIGGFCLVNDWSARDIQAFESTPLGPFLGKSFATSVSPWLVSPEALEPHRVPPPAQDPPVAPYLRAADPWGLDLHLEIALLTPIMAAAGREPAVISRVGSADLYWTPAQQLAHATVNGAVIRPGDLFASGTVSGPDRGSEGSLIELTRGGTEPLDLPDDDTRGFLEDGDTVILRGWARAPGARPIGLGQVIGTVAPPVGGS